MHDAFQALHYETPYITHYAHSLRTTAYEQRDPRTRYTEHTTHTTTRFSTPSQESSL